MNISLAMPSSRFVLAQLLAALWLCTLGACSTPRGYGIDERAQRTPDGSSGVVAGTAKEPSAAKIDSQSQTTYLSLIKQMQREGQYFASLAHIATYETRYGSSPESILLRGDALRLTGQPEAAQVSYDALKSTPMAGAGFRGKSLIAGGQGDFATAAILLEQAVELDSTDAVSLGDLGYARIRLGDLGGARVPLMTAAQLTPESPKALGNLALYLILNEKDKEAQAVMAGAKMNAQTRHAIYAQAHEIDPRRSDPESILLPATEPAAPLALAQQRDDQDAAAAPLRIDYAMSAPVLASRSR